MELKMMYTIISKFMKWMSVSWKLKLHKVDKAYKYKKNNKNKIKNLVKTNFK